MKKSVILLSLIVIGSAQTDYSLSFDGDNYIEVANDKSLEISDAITIQAWIRPEDLSSHRTVLGKWYQDQATWSYVLYATGSNGGAGFRLHDGSHNFVQLTSWSKEPVINEWAHLVATYNGSVAKVYINGTEVSSYSTVGTIAVNSNPLWIGKEGYGNPMNGVMDEIAIWNNGLSSDEVVTLYNAGSSLDASTNSGNYISSANLKGYWKFNEGAGTSVFDASGNGNDGIIYGADWDTTDSPFMPLVGNMFKIPHHHIEDYMHTAGVEIATGTWDVIASNGESSTSSANGPFTLTINASALSSDETGLVPQEFALHQNYPNPFNPTTTISYDLPEQAQVTLGIYDLLGKQIKTLVNHSQDAGNRITVWDGTDELGRPVSAGVYLYRIKAEEFTQTRKMLLLK